jgi:hypothetical protein
MSKRESNLLWLKDILDHLASCRQQLEWVEDSQSVRLLAETMLRDLECCKRLCETLYRRNAMQPV